MPIPGNESVDNDTRPEHEHTEPGPGSGRRWRINNHATTIGDVVHRYQRLAMVSNAINLASRDREVTERDRNRIDYDNGVKQLLKGMITHADASRHERREALTNLEHPNAAEAEKWGEQWSAQPVQTLYAHWNQTRKALDHDIADVAGVELLLGQVRGRDDIIREQDDKISELCTEIDDRDNRINELTEHLHKLDQDNMRLSDQLEKARDQGPDQQPSTLRSVADERGVSPLRAGVDRALPVSIHSEREGFER
ncbi:hypothetical protein [Nocardia sp. CA-120079]|uniref:hypothetical protein n=1 Tax=Nocardia sp. CA-120079 TaxID=3239974 RepID=UPI003D9934C2